MGFAREDKEIYKQFLNIICQKLESMTVKDEKFNVYNVFIQYSTILSNDEEGTGLEKYYIEALTLSLGNLNSNGI